MRRRNIPHRKISIHALCEEGDVVLIGQFAGGVISIHALCEEGDVMDNAYQTLLGQFLSTPSARRATNCDAENCAHQAISIHALCEEGDAVFRLLWLYHSIFLSTPSARRATRCFACCGYIIAYFYPRPLRGGRPTGEVDVDPEGDISIHALCEEGDSIAVPISATSFKFLSTPSARRATGAKMYTGVKQQFLSTPSARRATTPPG